MQPKRIVTIAVIILIPAIIIIGLISNKKKLDNAKQPIDRSNIAVKVVVDTVSLKSVDGTIIQPATIIAGDHADLAAETSGKISSLNIQLGTSVKKGQLIGHIDVSETEQKLAATELSIKKLNSDYERTKVLAEGNATNANAVADAKYELDAKKLDAAQLRIQISKADIIAPVSGIITDRQKIAGEYVTTGTTIASIIDVNTLKAKVSVPESQILFLKQGQTAIITSSSYPEKIFNGTISYISPKGDNNHNYDVQVEINNKESADLKEGLYVEVQFTLSTTKKSLLMISKNALTEGVKNPIVYVYKNGTVEERKLVTGIEQGNYIEVKKGLALGELVVTNGQINLSDGAKAEITILK